MSDELAAILAELRRHLEALYGPRLVQMVLYGSQARGDAEPGSDIDVLVVLQGPVDSYEEIKRTSEIVADLSMRHNVVISRVFVSPERFLHEQSPLLNERSQRGGARVTPEQAILRRKARVTFQGAQLLADNGLYDAAVSRA
jgi:predicted nucleotidyltransferase